MSLIPVGFSGCRLLPSHTFPQVAAVVQAVATARASVFVGDATGFDALVTEAAALVFHAPVVFSPQFPGPRGLVARSATLVQTVAGATVPQSWRNAPRFFAWPTIACPATISPAPAWKSGRSGTWSSIALALGLGLPVVIMGAHEPPPRWSVSWSPYRLPRLSVAPHSFKHTPAILIYPPAIQQPSLL